MAPVIIPDPNYRKNVEHFCLKKIYSSKHEADRARNSVVQRSSKSKGRDPLKAVRAFQGGPMSFFCDKCRGWHWGHSNNLSRRGHREGATDPVQMDSAMQNRSV